MNRYTYPMLFAVLAALLASFVLLTPALRAAEDKATIDSEEIARQLQEARSEAIQLKRDAEEMESFVRSKLSWESHASAIEAMKEHINAVGRLTTRLIELRDKATPWQETAIDRITPLLRELAGNTTATIEHLNNNKVRLHTQEYKDFVVANYELSSQLSALIGDFVDYGQSKAKFERLRQKLEVNP